MSDKIINIDIAEEIIEGEVEYEESALQEECKNAESNYNLINDEINKAKTSMPYPDVHPYDVAHDYDGISDLQFQKRQNEPYWKEIDSLEEYFNDESLYGGHLRLTGKDYYLMDSVPTKDSRALNPEGTIWLASTDDKSFNYIFEKWKFPKKGQGVIFSRNISMKNKEVEYVDIQYDESSSIYSSITDIYLRRALKRNKDKYGIQSIIQTIQEKQNNIRIEDKNRSFIVQGCAGSGKTMVLLHRLRYLLYNKDISSSDYALLLPNRNFRKYLVKSSSKFNIYEENLFSYGDYYKYLLDRNKEKIEEGNELIFPKQYLLKVYSKDFLCELSNDLISAIKQAVNTLIDLCDQKLSKLLEEEKKNLIQEYQKKVEDDLIKTENLLQPIFSFVKELVGVKLVKDDKIIDELKTLAFNIENELKEKRRILDSDDLNEELLEKYILDDSSISELRKEIHLEEERLNKASIFTKASHQKKLQVLRVKYDEALNTFKKEICKIERNKKEKELFGEETKKKQVLLDKLNKTIQVVEEVYVEMQDCKAEIAKIEEGFDNEFLGRFETEIATLQEVIEISSDVDFSSQLNSLEPFGDEICSYIGHINKLYLAFSKYIEKTKKIEEQLKILSYSNERELRNYLLSRCKKKLNDEFGYKPDKQYKHYWYLSLFFKFLLGGEILGSKNYLFIDEAQDLSVMELLLLYKINSNSVFNLFGDTNQLINGYGINNWDSVFFVKDKYVLDENFRNTTQIVDFCNSSLPYKMNPVGVDMSEVTIYNDVLDAISSSGLEDIIFIVKDEYKQQDLVHLLDDFSVKYNKENIYIVKNIKGLEFKEVYVFDSEMTENEKYIAYTRALVKLNVVKELPESPNRVTIVPSSSDDEEDIIVFDKQEKEVAFVYNEVLTITEIWEKYKTHTEKPIIIKAQTWVGDFCMVMTTCDKSTGNISGRIYKNGKRYTAGLYANGMGTFSGEKKFFVYKSPNEENILRSEMNGDI